MTALYGSSGTKPRVLVVDDERTNRELVEIYLQNVECQVLHACGGQKALDTIRREQVDLVLLDINMPGLDGFEVCRLVKQAPATRLIPVVMVTGRSDLEDHVKALDAGADDFLVKPIRKAELVARVRSLLRVKTLYDRLDDSDRVIFALAAAVEAKDDYTEAHTERVAVTAQLLGERMGLRESELDALYRGGMVHDIGKIGIPDSILRKAGALSPEETELMQRHPLIGEQIVSPLRTAGSLRSIIRHHHERIDGRGYPDGLAGNQIPLLARIVSVCDAFDAMVSERPYRDGHLPETALKELSAGAGMQWDRDVVAIFGEQLLPLHSRLRAS